MYCWNCGHKNPDDNKYCSECGERQGRPAAVEGKSAGGSAEKTNAIKQGDQQQQQRSVVKPEETSKPAAVNGPQKVRITDPLVEYAPLKSTAVNPNRRATDRGASSRTTVTPSHQRSVPQPIASDFGLHPAMTAPPYSNPSTSRMEAAKITNPLVAEPGVVRESLSAKPGTPVAIKKPVNRISGPSFLGLSDAPTNGGSSDDFSYLLEDATSSSSSSWPGVLALTMLIVFGVLLVKQWGAIHDFVTAYVQKEEIPRGQKPSTVANDAIHHPPAAVSSDETSRITDSAAQNADGSSKGKPSNGNRQMASAASSNSAAGSADTLQKPESDNPDNASAKSPVKESAANPADASDANTRTSKPSAARSELDPESKKVYDNSQVQFAEKYIYGRGVPQDCGRALSLLQSAASQQNPNAQIKLGALYSTGQCVSQDRAQAYRWYSKAKQLEPGNTWLQYSLNSLWASMSPEERQRAHTM